MKTSLLTAIKKAVQLARIQSENPQRDLDFLLEKNHNLDRRKFLKDTTLLSISALTYPVFSQNTVEERNPDFFGNGVLSLKNLPKIAIVGGGLAGLSAGYYLQKKGIKATIYEADKRIGGRIKSAKIFGNETLTTEIGAEFIDTQHTDMIQLAKDLNLWNNKIDVTEDTFGTKETFFIKGQHYSMEDLAKELTQVVKKIKSDSEQTGDIYETNHAKSLDNQTFSAYLDKLPLSQWVKDLLTAAFLGEQGLDPEMMSALNLIDTLDMEGNTVELFGDSDERYKIIGGNQQIPEGLANILGEQILKEHRLIALKEKADNTLQLTFDNRGKTIEETYDIVILALPLTILRGIEWAMDLPPITAKIIKELTYGANTKYVMEFNERTWRKANYQGYFFNEFIHNGWDSTHLQTDNKGVGTFTVFLGGEIAKQATKGNENNLRDLYLPVLEKAFQGSTDAFTGKVELANWSENPFVKASYSSRSVGQFSQFTHKIGLPVRNVYFAGEHCSHDHWGFMNGAAETGRLAAEKIVEKVIKK
jgi:monoamine oxidase